MTPHPLVIVESPYAARVGAVAEAWSLDNLFATPAQRRRILADDVRGNIEYARACLLDSVRRGEAPIASHLLYPQILDDGIPEERATGIECGLAWRAVAHFAVFYVDRGWSRGMLAARELYTAERRAFVERSIR